MFLNSLGIFIKAIKEGYAISSYNVYDLSMVKYILHECNKTKTEVVLSIDEKSINALGGYKYVLNFVKNVLEDLDIKIDVILCASNLNTFNSCKDAIDSGFNLISIYFSRFKIDEIRRVCDYAHKNKSFVELKLSENLLNANKCLDIISLTDADILALNINVEDKLNIDYKILSEICKKTKVPISIYKTLGLDENKLKTAIFCGVCKVEFDDFLNIKHEKEINEIVDFKNKIVGSKVL